MNIRFNRTRRTYRLRLPSVHPDQLETILDALAKARREGNTNYDAVALEGICMSYLGGHGKIAPGCKNSKR